MSGHFGLREAFHRYPSIEVLIEARGYKLSMVPFVLDPLSVVHRPGRRIYGIFLRASRASSCFFVFFEQIKLKTKKQDCMQTYIFLSIDNFVRQLA